MTDRNHDAPFEAHGNGALHDGEQPLAAGEVLDAAFIAELANAMYAEGMPDLAGDGVAAVEMNGAAEQVSPPAAGRPPPSFFRGFDFPHAHLFHDPEDDPLTALEGGLADSQVMAAQVGGEGFYFLRPAVPAQPAAPPAQLVPRSFPVETIRQDFPMLQQKIHGKPLIWMDNAATTQKPRRVIEALKHFYEYDNSNTRAQHTLATRVTNLYAAARDKVRHFLGAADPEEIVFTHGATEAINLVAQAYGRQTIQKGDEIVLSTIEHHANIVPWQQLVREKEAVLRVIPVNDRGEIILEEYEKLLGPRTRIVAITHVSNALGTILPVRTMTQLAHRHGARVLIDGAQSAPHLAVDVQALDCDFFIFAGHKLYGPTGIGVLYAKRALLDAMPPWQGGGNMMAEVTFEHTTYKPAPAKFEAGTAILAGAIGLGAAIDYLDELGMENLSRYEHELLTHCTAALGAIPGLRVIGTAAEKASVVSFVLDGVETEALGRLLDQQGIALRVGRH